jgi:hypothetical protein
MRLSGVACYNIAVDVEDILYEKGHFSQAKFDKGVPLAQQVEEFAFDCNEKGIHVSADFDDITGLPCLCFGRESAYVTNQDMACHVSVPETQIHLKNLTER